MTKSLRSVEKILKRYDLEIERKPNHGMKLIGKELDIRKMLVHYEIPLSETAFENFTEKRFFAHLRKETKEDVLEFLCEKIVEQEEVDEDFYDMVLERPLRMWQCWSSRSNGISTQLR